MSVWLSCVLLLSPALLRWKTSWRPFGERRPSSWIERDTVPPEKRSARRAATSCRFHDLANGICYELGLFHLDVVPAILRDDLLGVLRAPRQGRLRLAVKLVNQVHLRL